MTGHMHSCLCAFINDELWQSILEEDRIKIEETIAEVSLMASKWITQSDEIIKEELIDKGIVFTDSGNGLELNRIKSSVINQVNKDFPEWQHYIEGIQKVK